MSDGQEDEYDDDAPVIIIDNGSGVCKAGLSTTQQPTVVFPEIIGRPRERWRAALDRDFYCGDEVAEHRSKLSVAYPLQNGIIENFDEMQLLWDHTFTALGVDAREHPVLLTEPPYNPKANRERMVEIMFEYYMVPTLNISIQGVLALLGQGRTTGLVLDSGEGVTHTIPVWEGYGFTPHIRRLDLAGRDLNTLLAKLLAQEGTSLTTTEAQHHVRIMKETHCYCALDPASEFAEAVQYTLPDGREVTLQDERWRCPEALFNPSMAGIESQGVAGLVWDSINGCDIDTRRNLLNNVVLSGGSTMFPGFSERLAKDLKEKAPTAAQANIKVVQTRDQNQKYAVWSGAQVFASLRGMQDDQWMTIEDYDEFGASFIHDKIAVKFS
jgi:actin beta/gamma 1